MSVRLSALVLGLVALLTTGALTYAADQPTTTTPHVVAQATAQQQTLVVPDVRRQAYVFAKGILVDSGFAWRVQGGVRGFAANLVTTQTPAPGTRVVDNGAPTILLTLARNGKYKQIGTPQDTAPYSGTPIRIVGLAVATTLPAPSPLPTAAPSKSAATPKSAVTVKPATAPTPAAKTKLAYDAKLAVDAQPAAKAAPRAAAQTTASASVYPQSRPPAFVAPGAPKEPLDEMPLVDRARLLGAWLAAHPKPTNANVKHWLYQHEWVVQGAEFGWWHGSDALKLLIQDDRRAESLWKLGAKSEQVARATLAGVQSR